MCKQLEKVSTPEWNTMVERVHDTDVKVDAMKSQISKWAGGLSVLLFIIVLIGGFLSTVGFKLWDSVNKNADYNIRSDEKSLNVARLLENISAKLNGGEVERREMRLDMERKTVERYTAREAQTDNLELRSWVRECRDADRKFYELQMIQVKKDVDVLKEQLRKQEDKKINN